MGLEMTFAKLRKAHGCREFQVIELVCSPRCVSGFDSTKVCSSCNAEEGEWR
jgi:hypothetical protein